MKKIIYFISDTLSIAHIETLKIIRSPSEIITRSAQPFLWILIFGQVFARMHMDLLGGQSYIAFIAPGILAQSVLFISIFYGISIIWERDLGLLHKILVSPASRVALVLGKGIAAGIRSMSQVFVVFALMLLLRERINYSFINICGVILFVILIAALFSTFSTAIACIVKTRERFMGIGQVIIMPMFFASNAIYPIALMPHWLQVVSHWNPLTYDVDALRTLMLPGAVSTFGLLTDFFVLLITLIIFAIIGGKLYSEVVK